MENLKKLVESRKQILKDRLEAYLPVYDANTEIARLINEHVKQVNEILIKDELYFLDTLITVE